MQAETSERLAGARRSVLFALMATIGLTALDNTIVSTAIPSVVRDLGGFSEFPWVFSVYLLAQAVTVPLYGRLADLFGRKPVLFFGIGLFLTGSALCGAAWSMPTLIVFRGLQGIGAGAVLPIAVTIVGDIYSVKERGRVQGYLSGVWGVAAIIGPAFGGLFSQYVTWRWIFYLNLPVGALAVTLLIRHYHERVEKTSHHIDFVGAATLAGSVTLLVFGLLQGGVHWAWTSPGELGVLAGALVLGVAFGFSQRRAAEPFIPPWVLSRRALVTGNLAALFIGALLFGVDSYVPTFSQGVVGVGPVLAGFSLAAESVSWVASSAVAGKLYLRFGFRFVAILGGSACVVGALSFAMLHVGSSLWLVALSSTLMGVGFGFASTAVLVGVQSTVDRSQRGVVTGANMLGRSLGGAIGVAVFGSIANSRLTTWLQHPPASIAADLPHSANAASLILGGAITAHVTSAERFIQQGLYRATHGVFSAFVIVAVLILVAATTMPRHFDASANDAPVTDDDETDAPTTSGASDHPLVSDPVD